MMSILLKNGNLIQLDENYQPDLKRTIESRVRFVMINDNRFGFNYANTKDLVDKITNDVLAAIFIIQKMSENR